MTARGKRRGVGREMTLVLFLYNENVKAKLIKCKQTGLGNTAGVISRFNDTWLINFF